MLGGPEGAAPLARGTKENAIDVEFLYAPGPCRDSLWVDKVAAVEVEEEEHDGATKSAAATALAADGGEAAADVEAVAGGSPVAPSRFRLPFLAVVFVSFAGAIPAPPHLLARLPWHYFDYLAVSFYHGLGYSHDCAPDSGFILQVYEPVEEGSYIKMIDMVKGEGGQLQVNNISGYLPGRIVFFLIWTSTLQRTILTATPIVGFPKIQWRALDEINSGVCDGMTYEEIKKIMPEEYESRKKDKLRYRYPRGESYLDVIQRLEPVIIELERQRAPVVVISHQAVLRALYSYFADRPLREVPDMEVQPVLHQVHLDHPVDSCLDQVHLPLSLNCSICSRSLLMN
ncbi:hypothetical protein ACQ4PT_068548 [Festuca glaucescens]